MLVLIVCRAFTKDTNDFTLLASSTIDQLLLSYNKIGKQWPQKMVQFIINRTFKNFTYWRELFVDENIQPLIQFLLNQEDVDQATKASIYKLVRKYKLSICDEFLPNTSF